MLAGVVTCFFYLEKSGYFLTNVPDTQCFVVTSQATGDGGAVGLLWLVSPPYMATESMASGFEQE